MRIEIISPNGILYEGETSKASFPGLGGGFDVLPHHAPLVSALTKGTIRFEKAGKMEEQPIESGFVEVKDDELSVCIEQL